MFGCITEVDIERCLFLGYHNIQIHFLLLHYPYYYYYCIYLLKQSTMICVHVCEEYVVSKLKHLTSEVTLTTLLHF